LIASRGIVSRKMPQPRTFCDGSQSARSAFSSRSNLTRFRRCSRTPRMCSSSSTSTSAQLAFGTAASVSNRRISARVLGHKKCVQMSQVSSWISKTPPFPICEFSRRQRGPVNQAAVVSSYSEAAKDGRCLGVARSHMSGSRNPLRERSGDIDRREMRFAEKRDPSAMYAHRTPPRRSEAEPR